jgi:hypothetical protein
MVRRARIVPDGHSRPDPAVQWPPDPRPPGGSARGTVGGRGGRSRSTLGCVPRKFLAPRWLAFHLLTLVLVAVFCRLGWWQIRRAGQGNPLSFGYALEWPVFAAFTLFVWYRTVRDTVRPPGRPGPGAADPAPGGVPAAPAGLPVLPARPAPAPVREDEDPQLAAYNRYLAALAEADRQN